jgi:hypothetical protein
MLDTVAAKNAGIICIGAIPPDALAPTRYLCKRLCERFPNAKILVARWGFVGKRDEDEEQLLSAGATYVSATIRETRTQLLHALSTHPSRPVESTSEMVIEPAPS